MIRLLLWLVRLFDYDLRVVPPFYALVLPGKPVAEVTTNKLRALALHKELSARGEHCAIVRMAPVERLK